MKRNYRMTIAYDGTRFAGWQRQGSTENTIQGKLEAVLSRLQGAPVEVVGSGRTDAGVHARGQVANFRLDTDLSEGEICAYLNRYLPETVEVLSVKAASEWFHSRLNATEKTYEYRIVTGGRKAVFDRNFVYRTEACPDIEKMRAAARLFLGTHDFSAFCVKSSKKKSTVRTIYKLEVAEEGGELRIRITGNGFLHHMVRIVSGTLLEAGLGRKTEAELALLLQGGKREEAGVMLPACGLTLLEVKYD